MLVVAEEIAARGHAFAGRHQVLIGAVGVHDVLLIAGAAVARGLKDEAFSVGRPVGLGVLVSAGGELLQIVQVLRRADQRQEEPKFLHRDHCKGLELR